MKQSERVYEALKRQIVSLELAPSTPVPESEISASLGASRTPVREALQQLAREGLVRIVPGRGAFVAEISVADIVELAQMRDALEAQAARLASQSTGRVVLLEFVPLLEDSRSTINDTDNSLYYDLSRRLDKAVVDLTGNERLKVALDEIWAQVERMRQMSATHAPRLCETIDEHLAIISAITEGDPQQADYETRRHLSRNLDNLMRTIQSSRPVTSSAVAEA